MSNSSVDLDAFRDFERAAHDRISETYHDAFSAVTEHAIQPLLDAARVGPGTRLLDVAAGPGMLTNTAARRGAHVVGVDLAPAMVALASRLHPGLDFRVAGAEDLPFAVSSFDAIVSSFGVGHFSRPEQVVADFARVLAPQGVVALSWWQEFARNRINGIFQQVITQLGVTAAGALPLGPPVDRFSDRERFAELLRSAGFGTVRLEEVSFTHRLRDVDELWNLAMGSFARVSTIIRAQSEAIQQEIRNAVNEVAHQYSSPNGLEMPIAFRIASGVRLN
jgi:ubiquinone/menaquinone biosynthesis C-methylase UbiE